MKIIKDLCLTKGNVIIKTLTRSLESAFITLGSDAKIWQNESTPVFLPDVFKEQWFNKAIRQMETGKRWPFSVTHNGKVVGSSSYYDIDLKNRRTNIGYTWFTPNLWGTQLNSTVKFILLEYAFEQLEFVRVAFCIDKLNGRSCRALEKLGVNKEGVLRKHLIRTDGTCRDSVIFAITDDDWPTIRNDLQGIINTEDERN